jgi:predicted GNAT superfamily acetyltransferase
MSSGIVVRKCESLNDFNDCVTLQREIWGESDLEVEPVTMFIVATNTGGQVIGAFDGASLVGYTLAIAGFQGGLVFLHSHHTGVRRGYRDRGVGRLLKFLQREEALSRGIRLIQWTFDPLELRNAHFNLNRLGAICRRYQSNLYGITTSPLHRGLPTDRLLAEWHLDSPRVNNAAIVPAPNPETPALPQVTVELSGLHRPDQQNDPIYLQTLQDRIRAEFTAWFARGYAAVATRPAQYGASYVLVPWSPQ